MYHSTILIVCCQQEKRKPEHFRVRVCAHRIKLQLNTTIPLDIIFFHIFAYSTAA